MKNSISEKEALEILYQIYLSHTSKWYSALVGIVIGCFALPILAFSVSLNQNVNFSIIERSIFTILVILFMDAGLYLIYKVSYSLSLIDLILDKFVVIEKDITVNDYLVKLKSSLKKKHRIYDKLFSKQVGVNVSEDFLAKLQGIGAIIASLICGIVLFILIWWNYDNLIIWVAISEIIYIVTVLILRLFLPIL